MLKSYFIKTIVLIFLGTLSTSCQKKWQGKRITLPKISKEIISLRKNDQNYRAKYIELSNKGKNGTEEFENVVSKLIEIDRSNTSRMEEIVDEFGWPTFDKVSEEASNVAWLIVQHADRNPFFQEKCLKLLKKAVDMGIANPSNYAYLYDRVQLAKGKKQLYATQSSQNHNIYAEEAYFQPIEDESKVQERRKKMNIEQHVEHYALSLNFEYKIPSEEEAINRAKQFEISYKQNIKKAKQQMDDKNYNKAVDYFIVALKSDGYTHPKDYADAARAISLSKHERTGLASTYLLKSVFMGYKHANEFNTNPDFTYLKEKVSDFWNNDLMTAINISEASKKY